MNQFRWKRIFATEVMNQKIKENNEKNAPNDCAANLERIMLEQKEQIKELEQDVKEK